MQSYKTKYMRKWMPFSKAESFQAKTLKRISQNQLGRNELLKINTKLFSGKLNLIPKRPMLGLLRKAPSKVPFSGRRYRLYKQYCRSVRF